ncbi:MAG: HRDC domain-containing protein [Actinomycetota bacterium]|nr:HRDC domain-containing protein [Actinomycetota bacterium]
MTETSRDDADGSPRPVPLLAPRDGTPAPVESAGALARTAAAFAAGDGPVAIDAERASGYRYGQRAYLVQLRRGGAGTALIDPVHCRDLAVLDQALAGTEWVLHAASQDLPCLSELGMRPRLLFDTELAGRLAGFERVGLAIMVEQVLGYTLEKGHSAADWSTRPLPREWLTYAALDVEVLIELRDALEAELREQGKLAWAREEFAALVAAAPATARTEPWRRTSGIHRIRSPRALATVRQLWATRDGIARARDLAPGRVLPDSAIVAAAEADPMTAEALLGLPVFGGRATRRHVHTWYTAVEAARRLPDKELPPLRPPGDGPPPPHRWRERDPEAAARLGAAKVAVGAVAADNTVPVENLLSPETVRRLAWAPPDPVEPATVAAALRAAGAREWQIELTAATLAAAVAPESAGRPPVPDEH